LLQQSQTTQERNVSAIHRYQQLYEEGDARGVFRPWLYTINARAKYFALKVRCISPRHIFGAAWQKSGIFKHLVHPSAQHVGQNHRLAGDAETHKYAD
jgi:hypothetical protein